MSRLRTMRRQLAVLAALLAVPVDAAASASAEEFCATLSGAWDAGAGQCAVTRATDSGSVRVSAGYPADLVDDPTAGPVLREYLRKFFADNTAPDPRNGGGTVTLTGSTFAHQPNIRSVVFAGGRYLTGMAHPVEWLETFTFDLAEHRQLQLADLVCPGADPQQVIAPLVRPQIQARVGSEATGVTVAEFEPAGELSDQYRAWAVDGDNLVLHLPAARGPGGIPPGWLQPSVPLAHLRAGCAA